MGEDGTPVNGAFYGSENVATFQSQDVVVQGMNEERGSSVAGRAYAVFLVKSQVVKISRP